MRGRTEVQKTEVTLPFLGMVRCGFKEEKNVVCQPLAEENGKLYYFQL